MFWNPHGRLRVFGEARKRLRQRFPVQDAEALRGAGEGYIEFGRAARAAGEDALRIHDQDGVKLQALRLCRYHGTRDTRRPDHDAGAFTAGFVPDEFFDGRGQFVFG